MKSLNTDWFIETSRWIIFFLKGKILKKKCKKRTNNNFYGKSKIDLIARLLRISLKSWSWFDFQTLILIELDSKNRLVIRLWVIHDSCDLSFKNFMIFPLMWIFQVKALNFLWFLDKNLETRVGSQVFTNFWHHIRRMPKALLSIEG